MKHRTPYASGFTLIELLLVIAIIAVLAAIVIIAVNPARQLAQANNAQRRSNINTILNAVNQYSIDNRGAFPTTVTTSLGGQQICRTNATASTTCTSLTEFLTVNEIYLPSIPEDPSVASGNNTGYTIRKSTSSNPRITVSAPAAELSETMSVTR